MNWNCTNCKIYKPVTDGSIIFNKKLDIKGFTAFDWERNVIIISFRGAISFINYLISADMF